MNYISIMTLSGSILFLICLLITEKCKNFLSERASYFLYRAALLYFLIPLIKVAEYYRIWLSYTPILTSLYKLERENLPYKEMITDAGVKKSWSYEIQQLIFIIWIGVAVALLLGKIIRYLNIRRKQLTIGRSICSPETLEMMEKIRKEYRIRRKIMVLSCQQEMIPFTIGLFSPVIFIYEDSNLKHREFLLRHEMRHIKQMDILTKQLGELAVCIHWFNPLAYMLKMKLDINCETACDEFMMKNSPPEDKSSYGKLIVDNLLKSEEKIEFSSSLTKAGKRAEKRILKIMSYAERSRKNKIITGALIVSLILANSITALAYPRIVRIERVAETVMEEVEEFDINLSGFFVPDGDKTYSENQFIDEEGTIYKLNEREENPLDCEHSYLNGTYQEHRTLFDGSCIERTFEAQMCEHCNEILRGTQINQSTNTVCPH